MSGAMGGIGERGVPRAAASRRGHLRPLHELRLRRQHRGRRARCRRQRSRHDDAPAAHVEDTPDTPTIETLVDLSTPRRPAPPTATWTAADTLKNVVVMLRHPDGTTRAARDRRARRPRGRHSSGWRRVRRPAEVEAFTEADFAAQPGAGQGLHRARRRSAPTSRRHPLPGRPAGRRRHPRGSPARTSRAGTSSTSSPAATSPADGDDRGRRGPRRRPVPGRCGGALEIARGIEIGHIFQLGRKYAEALGPQGAGRERQAGRRHDGLLRHRRLARRRRRSPRRRYDDNGLCWPREVAPADVHIVADRQGRRRVRRGRARWPTTSTQPASGCCSTTGAVSRPA